MLFLIKYVPHREDITLIRGKLHPIDALSTFSCRHITSIALYVTISGPENVDPNALSTTMGS
jgi:hypothetical protein